MKPPADAAWYRLPGVRPERVQVVQVQARTEVREPRGRGRGRQAVLVAEPGDWLVFWPDQTGVVHDDAFRAWYEPA